MGTIDIEKTLSHSPALAAYRRELALWLSGDAQDDERLVPAGAALCETARELSLLPEQLLVLIRDGRPAPVFQEGSDRAARESQARAHRYTLAVNLLLDCYFE